MRTIIEPTTFRNVRVCCAVLAALTTHNSCSGGGQAFPADSRADLSQPQNATVVDPSAFHRWTCIDGPSHANLYDVFFLDGEYGWSAGAEGTLLRTVNGGSTWARSDTRVADELYELTFADRSRGWVVGLPRYGATVLGTIDGGMGWSPTQVAGLASVSSISFSDRETGWAFGEPPDNPGRSAVARTTDGGTSWSLRQVPPDPEAGYERLWKGTFLNAREGWAITGTSLKHTSDGGLTWQTSYRADHDPSKAYVYALTGILFLNTKIGWAWGNNDGELGYFGIVLHTADGGHTWAANMVEHPLEGMVFLNETTGLGVGAAKSLPGAPTAAMGRTPQRDGIIMATTDGGSRWTEVYRTEGRRLNDIALLPNNSVVAVGEGGTILRLASTARSPR